MLRETVPITIEPSKSAEWQPYANGNGTNSTGHFTISEQLRHQLDGIGIEDVFRMQETQRLSEWFIPMAAIYTYLSNEINNLSERLKPYNPKKPKRIFGPEALSKAIQRNTKIMFDHLTKKNLVRYLDYFSGSTSVQLERLAELENKAGINNGQSALQKERIVQKACEILENYGWESDSPIPISDNRQITYHQTDIQVAVEVLFKERSHFPFEHYSIYQDYYPDKYQMNDPGFLTDYQNGNGNGSNGHSNRNGSYENGNGNGNGHHSNGNEHRSEIKGEIQL